MRPTQKQVTEAVETGNFGMHHTKAEKRTIARACLILGVPVTDLLTSKTWYVMVDKLDKLDERLDKLENAKRRGRA